MSDRDALDSREGLDILEATRSDAGGARQRAERESERSTRLIAALSDEILLPPVRTALADLAAGLERLILLDPLLSVDADVADVVALANAVCDPEPDASPPRVIRPRGWSASAIVDGPLGPIPVTPAGVAFGAGCEAGWLARYCEGRPRAWRDMGALADTLARRLTRLAESLRSSDDERVEAEAAREVDIDLTFAIDLTIPDEARDPARRAAARLMRLGAWARTPNDLAAEGRFTANRPGTQAALGRLSSRLASTAQLLAQVESIRYGTVRSLAYGDVDEDGLDRDLADLWADTEDGLPLPSTPPEAEAPVIARLRDIALSALLAAADLMAIPVLDRA